MMAKRQRRHERIRLRCEDQAVNYVLNRLARIERREARSAEKQEQQRYVNMLSNWERCQWMRAKKPVLELNRFGRPRCMKAKAS